MGAKSIPQPGQATTPVASGVSRSAPSPTPAPPTNSDRDTLEPGTGGPQRGHGGGLVPVGEPQQQFSQYGTLDF